MALRILGLDPGSGEDAFAAVGIEFYKKAITVAFCHLWKRQPFDQVASDVVDYYRRYAINYIVVEKNGIGAKACAALSARQLVHYPVTTVSEVGPRHRDDWRVMPKGEMISWVRGLMAEGHLSIPHERSKPLQAFVDQFNAMASYRQLSGGVQYRARRSGHDDAFMAFLLAAHMARHIMREAQMN